MSSSAARTTTMKAASLRTLISVLLYLFAFLTIMFVTVALNVYIHQLTRLGHDPFPFLPEGVMGSTITYVVVMVVIGLPVFGLRLLIGRYAAQSIQEAAITTK